MRNLINCKIVFNHYENKGDGLPNLKVLKGTVQARYMLNFCTVLIVFDETDGKTYHIAPANIVLIERGNGR